MADARKSATAQVKGLELKVSQQLAALVAADEAIALERPQEGPVFTLDIIRTEEARLAAVRKSRVLANPGPALVED